MKTLIRGVLAALAGVLAFAGISVIGTEYLAPWGLPAALVSLPMSLVVSALVVGFAWLVLVYGDERSRHGRTSDRTADNLLAYLAGSVTFLVVGGVAVAAYGSASPDLLVTGLSVGLLAGLVAALVTARVANRRHRRSRTADPSP